MLALHHGRRYAMQNHRAGAGPGTPPVTFASILGGLYVDQWARDSGASTTQWTSDGGRVIGNVGTVTYAADGSNFSGQPVIGTTAGSYMTGSGFAELFASNSAPYLAGVLRFTSTAAFVAEAACVFSAGQSQQMDLFGYFASATAQIGSSGSWAQLPLDTSVHFFEVFADGAGNTVIGLDLTTASIASVPSTTTASSTGFSVGALPAGAFPADVFHSRYILASSAPDAGQRADMFALAKDLDGF